MVNLNVGAVFVDEDVVFTFVVDGFVVPVLRQIE